MEVKPHERFSSEHYQQRFARFESTLHNQNYHFLVVNELEIDEQPLLSNYENFTDIKTLLTEYIDNMIAKCQTSLGLYNRRRNYQYPLPGLL